VIRARAARKKPRRKIKRRSRLPLAQPISGPPDLHSYVVDLARLPYEPDRNEYLSSHSELHRADAVEALAQITRSKLRIDTAEALRLANSALFLARLIDTPSAIGLALRSKANVHYIIGENKMALELHHLALEQWRHVGDKSEIARTYNALIQPSLLLGEYDKAFEYAAAAKNLFKQLRDKKRFGHVQINLGNIFHRQDRFEEALACYEKAYKTLVPLRDSEGLAVVSNNMAACLITLNDFPRALATYKRARKLCVKFEISILLTQTDYNIAYLYYLRGEYGRAIEMLRQTRTACEQNGDAHVLALCYLDLSEIYLELNLSKAAAETARESIHRFNALGMGYEEAKSITNEAIALGQQGQAVPALELFRKARAIFVREKNEVWPWLIDLYRGLVLMEAGRPFEAQRFCTDALGFFHTAYLPGKTTLCHLILARLAMDGGSTAAARNHCHQASRILAEANMPILQFQANFLLGQLEEREGNFEAAYRHFVKAQESADSLRSNLHRDELKIAFIKDKTDVYQHLVRICVERKFRGASDEKAFEYMDRSKSRNLADEVFHNLLSGEGKEYPQSELAKRLQGLREQLNWYYHRMEIEQLSRDQSNAETLKALRVQIETHESQLLSLLREAPDDDAATAEVRFPQDASVRSVQATLRDNESVIEYFGIGERLVAAVITKRNFVIVPISVESRVVKMLQALRFQFSKFRLGDAYVQEFHEALLRSTNGHLQTLYDELIRPLAEHLAGGHLVIIPHSVLHEVPFHALHDGKDYLIASHTISFAPSAAIRDLCAKRDAATSGSALVLGVPDEQAPFIRDEVEAIAKILPNSKLYVGESATENVLKEEGKSARYIHIATHGRFREDNPMFSSIRLGTSYLNVHGLRSMRLPADLVTLSGCSTGQNSVLAGDELVGLVRGFLAAGPKSLLLSLWDIDDERTNAFMTAFYENLASGLSKVESLAQAMRQLMLTSRHPYYWAPFVLVGADS
jgi:CHAT domain-containing protein